MIYDITFCVNEKCIDKKSCNRYFKNHEIKNISQTTFTYFNNLNSTNCDGYLKKDGRSFKYWIWQS